MPRPRQRGGTKANRQTPGLQLHLCRGIHPPCQAILHGTEPATYSPLSTSSRGRKSSPRSNSWSTWACYLDLHDKYTKKANGEKVDIVDDIVFEMELVKSVEINIDYVLFLVDQKNGDAAHDREIAVKIKKTIGSTPELRNKQDLILDFVDGVSPGSDVEDEWHRFIARKLNEEVNALIGSENLRRKATLAFLEQSFHNICGGVFNPQTPPGPMTHRGKRKDIGQAVQGPAKTYWLTGR